MNAAYRSERHGPLRAREQSSQMAALRPKQIFSRRAAVRNSGQYELEFLKLNPFQN